MTGSPHLLQCHRLVWNDVPDAVIPVDPDSVLRLKAVSTAAAVTTTTTTRLTFRVDCAALICR